MTAKYDALCKKYDVSIESDDYGYFALCENYSEYNIKRIQDETSEVGESINPPPREFKNVGNKI